MHNSRASSPVAGKRCPLTVQFRAVGPSAPKSRAAQSGILTEIAECDLFVQGIGRDKISDMTTNIVRRLLIEYTQAQCNFHGIPLIGEVASGRLWDAAEQQWEDEYVSLPVVAGKKVILVPKYSVRYKMAIEGKDYYDHFALNFLQDEEIRSHSGLVRVFKNGRRFVSKKDLKKRYPYDKDWLAEFSEKHPKVLAHYKRISGARARLRDAAAEGILSEEFDEASFAQSLQERLREIPAGRREATTFHKAVSGILEFLFWPNWIYPMTEHPIHEGRKRIDITYTNAAQDGFFYRLPTGRRIPCGKIMVECKNYFDDPANPELDQLAGRFNVNRGQVGLLVCRNVVDAGLLLKRCRDTAKDGRGYILVLGDEDINQMLHSVAKGNRKAIDQYLERKFDALID